MSGGANDNPLGLQEGLLKRVRRAYTCEYASLTRKGAPITVPVTPHLGADGRTIDLCTGLAYPLKAERARRNRNVTLLFSDATGSGIARPDVYRVHGEARVRDADLQANTDRYLALSATQFSLITGLVPRRWQRQGAWYLARIWIEITPTIVLRWPGGRTDEEPEVWRAPNGTHAPASDPPPAKKGPGAAFQPKVTDWREAARYAVARLGAPVLTTVDADGRPIPVRARLASVRDDGFTLHLPTGAVHRPSGPACLTFHAHPKRFTGQENVSFVGDVTSEGDGTARFVVARQLGAFSLGRSLPETIRSIAGQRKRLHARVKAEAARRGQPVPEIRL